MRIEKISNRQFMFIVFIMRATVVIATLPILTSADAGQDAWASALLVLVGTSLLVMLIAGLGVRFPQLSVVEISQNLLGRLLGALVSLVPLWAFLHLAAIEVRIYSEMIIVNFLPDTPIAFLTAVMILVAVSAAFSGVEVIGRMADFVFPIFVMVLTLSVVPLFFGAEFTNLQPVLSRGFAPVLNGSIVSTAVASELLVIGMLIPHLNSPKKAVSSALWGVLGASLILIVISTMVVATLGPDQSMRAVFPLIKAIRSVRVSAFLERAEILAVFSWGFGIFVALSTFVHSGARGLSTLFKISDYRHILLPMSVFWIVLSIHDFENVFQIRSLFAPEVMGPYGLLLILIPYSFLWSGYLIYKIAGKIPQDAGEGER